MEQARNHSETEANPVKTPAPAVGGARVTSGRRLTPERIASKTPTGLPPVDRSRYAQLEHGDPVRRAASRIVTLDNANMAASDSCVDVDGKSFDAHRDAPLWHDNEIHSNASLDDSVSTSDDGLAGFASLRGGGLAAIGTRLGWQVSTAAIVDAGRTIGARTERVIRLEPTDPPTR